jgi:hypothetical protein
MKGKEFKPPSNFALRDRRLPTVFLGGSIEMGKAVNWQMSMGNTLREMGYNVLNPRRDDWDSSWEQLYENPKMYQQVSWELNGLEVADIILIWLENDTLSPISLLELGKFADTGKVVVYCANNYLRKANVDIFCSRYNIPIFNNPYDLCQWFRYPKVATKMTLND